MNPIYHIFYRPRGQKGSHLSSITPVRQDEDGNVDGYASGPFVRGLWDRMLASALQHGWMKHPTTGEHIEFASLQFGGFADGQGNGQGGMLCQKWSREEGRQVVFEPEPELYDPEMRRRAAAASAPAFEGEVPEQPAPAPIPHDEPAPSIEQTEVAAVDGLDAYGSGEPITEAPPAPKRRRAKKESTVEG